ncbi:MAG: murein L,D-transpeptidase [Methylobacterium sp.]|nr:murein L,D-transpeptidase [Methylobacterium sp.]
MAVPSLASLLRDALLLVLMLLALAAPAAAQPAKALAPIPAATLALMTAKSTSAAASVLFRAYKKESEIEVWKKAASGRFVHVKTYPICRWSGQLGPKRKTGDRQTPEGFYTVARSQLNPNSSYYLSFDVGYPNAYDRAHGYTGSAVMVHGVCSSMGCFAMTDAVAGELYAIAREAFDGGQAAFQFQSFPFRMNAANMARHRTDPEYAFWRQLKEGSDRFEATGEEPVVGVADRRYVFAPSKDPRRELEVVSRRAEEDKRIAALIAEGSAAIRTTYSDGGQHPFWAAFAARGGSVGIVSRPEALAYAGQEVVVIPARRAPVQVAEAVWSRWIAGSVALARWNIATFVPSYERPLAAFPPLVVAYAETLPRIVSETIAERVPPLLSLPPKAPDILAQR